MASSSTEELDLESSGFFRRNRVRRLTIGVIVTAVLIAAYLFGIQSYRSGLAPALPAQVPPAGGVSVVIVPEQLSADKQEVSSQVLVFPSPELLDGEGNLTKEIEIAIRPAIFGSTSVLPAGQPTEPQSMVLPAAGTVQEYPFDRYSINESVRAHVSMADTYDSIPVTASVFFRSPGLSWNATADQSVSADSSVQGEITRDGSTKSIAILILTLMVVLALIAILVTGSSTRGRMRLDLSVASWMTALLFALIPLRGFFPGQPPLGSWMDVLVFFWVELIIMLCVAAVVATILMRARDARTHQQG